MADLPNVVIFPPSLVPPEQPARRPPLRPQGVRRHPEPQPAIRTAVERAIEGEGRLSANKRKRWTRQKFFSALDLIFMSKILPAISALHTHHTVISHSFIKLYCTIIRQNAKKGFKHFFEL